MKSMHGTPPQTMGSAMLRGEIWQVNLDTARGNEVNKPVPAVVVSNDRANATAARLGRGVVTVVPVTSNVARIYPFQGFLSAATSGLAADSKAQPEQIRSVAAERLRHRIGRVSPAELAEIDQALRLHLEL
jgi:mRNA interferase MazF